METKAIPTNVVLRSLWDRLGPLIREFRGYFGWGIFFVFLGLGLTLFYPQVIRIVIDEGIQQGRMDRVNELALVMIAILMIEAPATYMRTWLFSVGGRKIIMRIQRRFHALMLRQEIGFFDEESAAELSSRLTSDTFNMGELVSDGLPEALRFALYGIFGIGFMLYTSPLLTAMVLIVGPPIAYGTSVFSQKIQRRQADLQTARAMASASALESYTSIRTVRAYVQESAEYSRYSGKLDREFEAGNRQLRSAAMLESLTSLSSESAVVLAIWAGGALVLGGSLTAGALISFIFYTGLVVRAFRNLSRFTATLMRTYGGMQRIFDLMAREPLMPSSGGAQPQNVQGLIELEDVHFRYPTRPNIETLRGVNLKVGAGEFVAVVGRSGSGKSTISGLIARFYDVESGRVLIDGVDVRELDPTWLRSQVTLVSQDSSFFSRTIDENVRFGNLDASPEELDAALRVAQARELVDRLPEGIETYAGDRGTVLSGGQRQRLAVARALLRRPKILILDEATSAVDSESEAKIKDGLRKLEYHPTILIVAHRLSTVVDVDRVVVVDDGKIVASGPHSELIQNSSVYQELVENQLIRA